MALTILDAMEDPRLFGREFSGESWDGWRAFLAVLFGLGLEDEALDTYRLCTGRTEAPTAPFSEAHVIVGRRGGKSRISAAVAVYLACFRDYSDVLVAGEVGVVMVLAADRKQSRVVFRYIEGLIDSSPMLAKMVVSRTKDSIELNNRIVIEVHTASFRSVRGYSVAAVVADELAFWRSDESANPDTEILAAVRPSMATIPGALLLAISTPYSRRGELWKAYKKHHGQDGAPVLVWRASTQTMNPTVPESIIAEAYERDPVAAAAEYGAEFRSDIEGFVSAKALAGVVVADRVELPPVPGTKYAAFVDPSGGARDSFTLGIAHREDTLAVLDCLREYRPPFSPESVVDEICATIKAYGITEVTGDRYAGEWPPEQFRKRGIRYITSDKTKSDLYRELLPAINSGRCELLDNERLNAQLMGLERRTARSGKDSIDHGPGGHDDLANAAAGALLLCTKPVARMRVGHFYPTGSGGCALRFD